MGDYEEMIKHGLDVSKVKIYDNDNIICSLVVDTKGMKRTESKYSYKEK